MFSTIGAAFRPEQPVKYLPARRIFLQESAALIRIGQGSEVQNPHKLRNLGSSRKGAVSVLLNINPRLEQSFVVSQVLLHTLRLRAA